MTSSAYRNGLLARIATTPRLRPILTAMAAIVLLTGASLPGAVLAAPAIATPVAVSAQTPAQIVERAPTDNVKPGVVPAASNAGATTATKPTTAVKAAAKPAFTPVAKPVVKLIPPKVTPPKVTPPKVTTAPAEPVVFKGANHLWIPALGIDRSVYGFSCTRSKEPDNLTYRWGCAGSNNVYLLGHAYGVFKPLHDAYYNGKLKKGLKVVYADAAGTVHTYSVIWWKVVKPTTDAAWAWAPLSSPGMTLQTCLGANSEYRLMIRLDEVD